MQMQHHFTVPVPIDAAWDALLDPERVAPCMPGARLTKVEGSEFTGSVKVKLGPISLQYKGTGAFTTVDTDARRVVIDASGKDARGNGTASASVTAALTEESGGTSTSVQVDTDLKVTGKPAQMGRGLISDVAGKILDQFAECLSEKLAGGTEAAADTGSATSAGSAASAGSTGSSGTTGTAGTESGHAARSGNSGESGSSGDSEESGTESFGTAATSSNANGQRRASSRERSSTAAAPVRKAPGWRVTPGASDSESDDSGDSGAADERSSDEAIDLLGTAGAPVLKRVAPLLAALALITAAIVVLRRRRHR